MRLWESLFSRSQNLLTYSGGTWFSWTAPSRFCCLWPGVLWPGVLHPWAALFVPRLFVPPFEASLLNEVFVQSQLIDLSLTRPTIAITRGRSHIISDI